MGLGEESLDTLPPNKRGEAQWVGLDGLSLEAVGFLGQQSDTSPGKKPGSGLGEVSPGFIGLLVAVNERRDPRLTTPEYSFLSGWGLLFSSGAFCPLGS